MIWSVKFLYSRNTLRTAFQVFMASEAQFQRQILGNSYLGVFAVCLPESMACFTCNISMTPAYHYILPHLMAVRTHCSALIDYRQVLLLLECISTIIVVFIVTMQAQRTVG